VTTRAPLFVLLGDSFLCDQKRQEILSQLEKEFGPNLPVVVRRAGEVPVGSLISEARTLPFLASAQVFCLRDVDQWTKNDLALWKDYFPSPHPRAFFIFEAESLEKSHPLLEGAARAKQLFLLPSESEKIVARFIREKLKQAGKKITPEALEVLGERLGSSFGFLDSFLNQLILGVGENPEIDRSTIEAFDERFFRWEGQDLIQALVEKNVPRSLEALQDLVEQSGRDFPSVLGLLHWQLRRLWDAKQWLAQGVQARDLAARLGLFGRRADEFSKHLERFSLEELEKILEGLFDLDWRLKTGRAEGRYEIETWLINAAS